MIRIIKKVKKKQNKTGWYFGQHKNKKTLKKIKIENRKLQWLNYIQGGTQEGWIENRLRKRKKRKKNKKLEF